MLLVLLLVLVLFLLMVVLDNIVVDKLGKLIDLVPAFTAGDMPRRNPTAAAGLARELGVTKDDIVVVVVVVAGAGTGGGTFVVDDA